MSDLSTEFISSLGIPTRNRPDCLARCLQSYMANAERFGRKATFIIVEDSESEAISEESGRRVEQLSREFSNPVIFLGRAQRLELTGRLAEASGLPFDLTRYALLGDERCESSYGAARNTLLLATAGQPTVQVDDDTICDITDASDGSQEIEITELLDVGSYTYFKSIQEALDSGIRRDADFLSLHERLLGKCPGDLISLPPDNTRLAHPAARIVNSFLGSRGDSGMQFGLNRLLLEGASFERLIDPPADYTWKRDTRSVARATDRFTIGTTSATMTMNIGIDNRILLPPFSPNLRNEDGVFGASMGLCIPGSCKGFIPYTIGHDPMGQRTIFAGVQIPMPRFNDLLAAALSSFATGIIGDAPEVNVRLLGQYLSQLAAQPAGEFKEYIVKVARRLFQHFEDLLNRKLEESASAPDYWRKDIVELKAGYKRVLDAPDYSPRDLDGQPEQRWALAQELMGRFAGLLKVWPEMAASFRNIELKPYGEAG